MQLHEPSAMAELCMIGLGFGGENFHWHCHCKLEKNQPDGSYEVVEVEGNLATTLGANAIWTLLTGGAFTPKYDAANAWMAVGDGNGSVPTATAADVDLTATLAAGKTITAATNATPISVTATAHGYATGNTITVTGVTGNTAANGTWSIVVVDANTLTLNGSVGNGSYVSGGTAQLGNRSRKGMQATYPLVSTNQVQFQGQWGANDGNFQWNEFGMFNANVAGTMLNHKGVGLGTKVSGAVWTLTATLTLT